MKTINIVAQGGAVLFSFETNTEDEEKLQAEVMGMIEKHIGKIDYAIGLYSINGAPSIPYFREGSTMSWHVAKSYDGTMANIAIQYEVI